MAQVAEAKIHLTKVEVDHIMTLLQEAAIDGNYYGDKEEYWNRHMEIENKLIHPFQ